MMILAPSLSGQGEALKEMLQTLFLQPEERGEVKTISIPRSLAEEIMDDLCELRGERDWWKDEPRLGHQRQYKELENRIKLLSDVLKRKVL
jgi:hypothetical protein